MGKVNDYINKLISFIKNEKPINKEKPWLKYYGDVRFISDEFIKELKSKLIAKINELQKMKKEVHILIMVMKLHLNLL